jgi:hypothetical protein
MTDRGPTARTALWLSAALLSLASPGCTGHPVPKPDESGLVDGRIESFTRYQRAIELLSEPAPDSPRRRYERLRVALAPEGIPLSPAHGPGPQGLGRLRRSLVAMPADPGLLAGYLQHHYRLMARAAGTLEDRPGFARQWSYWGRAAALAYRRTRDPWFLELVARGFEHLDGLRGTKLGIEDGLRHAVLPSWPVRTGSGDYRYRPGVAGLMTLPACQLAHIVQEDPALQARFSAEAERFLAVTREALEAFAGDYQEGQYGYGRFVRPGDGKAEPLDHTHAYASALECLNHKSPTPLRPEILKGLQRAFVAALWRSRAGSIAWGHAPNPPQDPGRPAQWVWRAAVTIVWPYEAYRLNGRFDVAFLRELARTFRSGVYLGDGSWNARISADERVELVPRGARAQSLSAWNVLAEFDSEVRRLIEEAVSERQDLFPAGWLGSAPGAYAYAFRLAETATR